MNIKGLFSSLEFFNNNELDSIFLNLIIKKWELYNSNIDLLSIFQYKNICISNNMLEFNDMFFIKMSIDIKSNNDVSLIKEHTERNLFKLTKNSFLIYFGMFKNNYIFIDMNESILFLVNDLNIDSFFKNFTKASLKLFEIPEDNLNIYKLKLVNMKDEDLDIFEVSS